MADIRSKLGELYSLEQLSTGHTIIHRIHPRAKLAVTMVYLFCIVSSGRYALLSLIPFLFYPAIMLPLAEIPYRMILKRAMVTLPFCLFAGVSNLMLDRTPLWHLGAFPVTAGLVSLLTILLRTLLCVSSVLILIAVTPFSLLTAELRRLHVPNLLVTLLEMVYRYIIVLLEEAFSMVTAYRLRCPGAKWPDIRHMGPFVGQLLLRSFDRAERIHQAMQCRCYALRGLPQNRSPFGRADWLFLLSGGGSALLFRLTDIPMLLGGLLT